MYIQTIDEQMNAYEQGLRELMDVSLEHLKLKKEVKASRNETLKSEKDRQAKQLLFEQKKLTMKQTEHFQLKMDVMEDEEECIRLYREEMKKYKDYNKDRKDDTPIRPPKPPPSAYTHGYLTAVKEREKDAVAAVNNVRHRSRSPLPENKEEERGRKRKSHSRSRSPEKTKKKKTSKSPSPRRRSSPTVSYVPFPPRHHEAPYVPRNRQFNQLPPSPVWHNNSRGRGGGGFKARGGNQRRFRDDYRRGGIKEDDNEQ